MRVERPPPQRAAVRISGLLSVLLLSMGCRQGQPATPGGDAGDTRLEFDVQRSRPLIVDLNGDGVADWIVRNTSGDGYIAINGATGVELWRTAPTRDRDPTAFAFVAGTRLISVGSSVANVFDATTGAFVRAVDVDGIPEVACEAPGGKARIVVRNGTVLTFDTDAGELAKEAADAPCTELRTDVAERTPNTVRRTHPVTFMPADVPAVLCGAASTEPAVGGGGHVDEPDACANLGMGVDSEVAAAIVPTVVITTDRGDLVLGHRRSGPPLPALELVSEGKLVWSAFPAVDKEGSAERVAVDGGKIALLYDDSKGARLFSWELATGKPVFDVALSQRAHWLDARAGRWLVSGNSLIVRVDEANGALRPIVGGLEAAEPEWNPGWPVPRGYVEETHGTPDGKEMGIGAALFAGTMIVNVSLYGSLGDNKRLWPLLVPFVGPFIAMGTVPPQFGVVTGLIFDAAAQGTGIVLFSVGAAHKTKTISPVVEPSVGLGTVGVRGAF